MRVGSVLINLIGNGQNSLLANNGNNVNVQKCCVVLSERHDDNTNNSDGSGDDDDGDDNNICAPPHTVFWISLTKDEARRQTGNTYVYIHIYIHKPKE